MHYWNLIITWIKYYQILYSVMDRQTMPYYVQLCFLTKEETWGNNDFKKTLHMTAWSDKAEVKKI